MSIKADIHKYVDEHRGMTLYINDMMADLELAEDQRGYTQHVMREMAASGQVKVKLAAEAWVASRNGKSNTLYERIAVSKSDVWVMSDEDGNVVLLKEVK